MILSGQPKYGILAAVSYNLKGTIMISRVTGTEDILDLRLYNFFTSTAQKHFESFNFHEIRTPILEYTHLFIHSLGEHTDVVSKEMYVFSQESEKSVCLRPEMTASTIRACFENRVERFPWKVFSYGPAFRHERPQKGRLRQFHQFNIEIIGAHSVMHDAHCIAMLKELFSANLQLEHFVIKLNFLGCSNDRQAHKAALINFLEINKEAICATCQQRTHSNTLRVFDCKNTACQTLYKSAPTIIQHLCADCSTEWAALQDQLRLLGVNFIIDNMLVRGLDYYQKTVFEFSSNQLGAQNAFCGGGRYALGREVGAQEDYACFGVAIGIERVLMLLELIQEKLALPTAQRLHVIIPMTKAQDTVGLLLAHELRRENLACDIILDKASATNMMKKANKLGASWVLIIGENEQNENTVMLKNMMTGESTPVKQEAVIKTLKGV
jgi:histidyl-tRNA synthetase